MNDIEVTGHRLDYETADTVMAHFNINNLTLDTITLQPNSTYKIDRSGWSTVYIPQNGSIKVSVETGKVDTINQGGFLAIPSGRRHLLSSTDIKTPYLEQSELRINLHNDPEELYGARPTLFKNKPITVVRIRASNRVQPLIEAFPIAITLTEAQLYHSKTLRSALRMLQEYDDFNDPIGNLIASRLGEVMALSLFSLISKQSPAPANELLRSKNDPLIRQAIASIHEQPAHGWSVEELAKTIGLSRSSFAQRFKLAVGQSPMDYLGSMRMNLAKGYLLSLDWSVSEIAFEVGYNSEAAFINAFKREVGESPGKFRKTLRKPKPPTV
ncbi:MAG: hypothetical protein CMF31_00280 [Kordiimonas sp.]|nr:hypothetical protein [Kordiimonas sp.]